MKTYKTVPAHVVERKELDKTYCDISGREIVDDDIWRAINVHVNLTEYSGGEMISCYQIDMHPDVFMNEFVEWIKSKNPAFELKDVS